VITYALKMKPVTTLTATEARANLFKLLDQAAEHHEPIQITGRRHNGVLVSEEDFRAMEETLYLLGVPGVKESLLAAKKAPVRSYSRKRPW
jgi:antitoxin YefM